MRTTLSLLVAGVVLLAALPALLSAGLLIASIQMLIAALFASAYGMLSGRAGMLSFGHAAYFGLGAYAGGLLLRKGHRRIALVLPQNAYGGDLDSD